MVTKPSLWQTTLTEDCAPAPAVATPGCAPTTLASVTCLPGAAVTPAIDTTPGKITIINDKGEVKNTTA
ncbi:hypothetical protein MKQ70_02320 [Chitinophaga sedimenti]|uniref:hypothetical protein n=1 Tax=Chitinophaga sedimenti TaxID=2033606 RepID=UPI002002A888|nr:hypothetical protein [Chitinophaga sedimenti]MCK7553904.1 hypothetical protein [Chitinophaga sedimenti]